MRLNNYIKQHLIALGILLSFVSFFNPIGNSINCGSSTHKTEIYDNRLKRHKGVSFFYFIKKHQPFNVLFSVLNILLIYLNKLILHLLAHIRFISLDIDALLLNRIKLYFFPNHILQSKTLKE